MAFHEIIEDVQSLRSGFRVQKVNPTRLKKLAGLLACASTCGVPVLRLSPEFSPFPVLSPCVLVDELGGLSFISGAKRQLNYLRTDSLDKVFRNLALHPEDFGVGADP
ncbi:hypothetical protein D3C72_1675620 [compost metagenome]